MKRLLKTLFAIVTIGLLLSGFGIGLALGVLAIVATTTLLLSPLLLIGWLIWRLARPARPVRVSAA